MVELNKSSVYSAFYSLLMNLNDNHTLKVLSMTRRLVKGEGTRKLIADLENAFREKGPLFKLLKALPQSVSDNSRKKLIRNLINNAGILGKEKRCEIEKKEGFMPPFFFVISPSARCNLNCIGCYAGDYTKNDDLPIEVVDRLLTEAKELGIYFITISGGEPFIRKDILEMFEKHNDMYFLVYTNGQLLDEGLAKRLGELGNVAPGISVEGFEKETDYRRGKGVHKNIIKAMGLLKKHGVLFGFSATPTSINSDVLMQEEFLDYYISKGAKFGWFFQYIPIGKMPDVNLMATPEQRDRLRRRINEWRKKQKPIFIGDFWNDGPLVGGCIAGGRQYFHINCKGDVEPCVFMHFAVDNIKNMSLKEALNSGFFKAIRKAQPYCANKNLLTPCAIIDHPQVLRGLVKKYGARPTHKGSESIIEAPEIIEHLNNYSKRFKALSDPIWDKDYREAYNKWFGKTH